MTRGILVASVLWIASLSVALPRAEAPQSAAPRPASSAETLDRSVVDKYCVTCHNQRLKTGGLTLDTPDLANVAAHPDVWEKVIRKVEAGMMPPAGVPRPDAATRKALVANLEGVLDRAAKASPNPGRPLVHRLNRAEYANAIRDLLAVDLDVSALLPPDDSSAGFDNNADVLGLSPVLLESYLTAAERISALAVGDPKTPPMGELFRVRQDESQDRHIDGLPIGTVGGLLIQTTLPLDGEYQFQVRLFRTNLGTMRGLEYPHQLEISVNGERVHLASFGGDKEIAVVERQPDHHRRRCGWAVHRAGTPQGGTREDRCRVPREDTRAQHAASAVVRAKLRGHDRLLRQSSHRRSHPDRAVQGHRRRRHAKPSSHLRVPAESGRRRAGLRATDSDNAGAACVSRRCREGRRADADGVLPARPP